MLTLFLKKLHQVCFSIGGALQLDQAVGNKEVKTTFSFKNEITTKSSFSGTLRRIALVNKAADDFSLSFQLLFMQNALSVFFSVCREKNQQRLFKHIMNPGETQMANKHMKRFSILPVIREMEIKITIRYIFDSSD